MTIQAWWLLKRLKQAQMKEDRQFGIIYDEMKIATIHDATEKSKTVKLICYRNSIHSVLDYLVRSEYIVCNAYGNGQVLHKGWHLGQTIFSSICMFLLKSIAVPIVVSFLTALVTMWLSGTLQLS